MPNNPEGHSVTTFFMGIKPSFYLNNVEAIFSVQDYENLRTKWGSYSNGYENMMYFAFKDKMNQIELVGEEQFKTEIANNFHHRDYSRVEYLTVLPTNVPNSFAVYFQVSNSIDSRVVNVEIIKNGSLFKEEQITVTGRGAWYTIVNYDLNLNIIFFYHIRNIFKKLIKTLKLL